MICTRRYQEMELPPYRTNLLTNSALFTKEWANAEVLQKGCWSRDGLGKYGI